MTQEEKLKEAKKLYETANADQRYVLESLFPELKESEDEKIMEELIEYFRWNAQILNDFDNKKVIAWLEKQGKETSWKPSKEEMDVLYGLAYITNQYDEHKEEVITRLYQDLKREFFNGSSYENMFPNTEDGVRRRSTIQVLEYAKSLDTYNQYGKADIDKNIAWLEKQGKKDEEILIFKDQIESLHAAIKAMKETHKINLENQGEQKHIPKHKIGDTIYYYSFGKVESMIVANVTTDSTDNPMYEDKEGNAVFERALVEQNPAEKVEPKFKVGDWVVVDDGRTGRIIECTKDFADVDLEFSCLSTRVNNIRSWTIQDAKDSDILVHSSFMFGDFIFIYNNTSILQAYCYYSNESDRFVMEDKEHLCLWNMQEVKPATKEQRDLLFAKMKEAGYEWDANKKELKKIEQKPAWSEEDEKILSDIIKDLVHPWNEYIPDRIEDEIKWLKNKLKSLRPQTTWKPTERQLSALDYQVKATCQTSWQYKETKELLEQLKKLREE